VPLEPEVEAILKQLEEAGAPPISDLTPEMAREAFAGLLPLQGEPETVRAVEEHQVAGPAGNVPVRVYRPWGVAEPSPVFYLIHGGGWVIMDLDSHDPLCRALANASGCAVVAVHYRRAPEASFPAAADDCYAVLRWIAEDGASIGIDSARIAVGGDSAGGNLAAAMTLLSRREGGPGLVGQVLHCPVTNHGFDTQSYRDNGEGYLLTADAMRWFWGHYLGDEGDGSDPVASPLRADNLAGLPPALVQTAQFDPLLDEGRAYADRLRESGVPVTYTEYSGVVHDPWLMFGVVPKGRQALDEVAGFLKRCFAAVG
jgi:acetyl esterase